MISKNPAKNKNYEGPVHGGEGKEKLKSQSDYEYMGVHRSAPNPKLKTEPGFTSDRDGAEEKGGINAALGTKTYGGPVREALNPVSLGVRNPDDVHRG